MVTAEEAPRLLAVPGPCDTPALEAVKVHRDNHAEAAKSAVLAA